jgi:hypothetical protein
VTENMYTRFEALCQRSGVLLLSNALVCLMYFFVADVSSSSGLLICHKN